MTLSRTPLARFAMLALAAAALAACSSTPKPTPLAAPPPPPPPAVAPQPEPAPPPVTEDTGAPKPGSVRDFVINAGDRVYFDTDQYNIRDDARAVLDAQAAWLERYPAVKVRIEGNCDERGTREYNFGLGARRAAAVKDYLVGHGLSADRIETISFGKEHPIDTGTGEDAWAHNRNGHSLITDGAR